MPPTSGRRERRLDDEESPRKRAFLSMSAKAKVSLPPMLPRATIWTPERVGRLTMIELRQLKDNALRLGEPEIATLCDEGMTRLRREATAARKALPPKPRKPVPVKVTEE
jgi:hypothetical protein